MNQKSFVGNIFQFVFLISLIVACADDHLNVGLDVLPSDDRLIIDADTLPVNCATIAINLPGQVYASGSASDNCPLGFTMDPLFGETSSELYMQLEYDSETHYGHDMEDDEDTYVGCKIYLYTNPDYIYGDVSDIDVDIYPLQKTLTYGSSGPSTNYKIESDLYKFAPEEIVSTKTEYYTSNTGEEVANLDSGNYLVITLSENFGQSLMDSLLFTSQTNFLTEFPGFYLKARRKANEGGIVNFFYQESKVVMEYIRHGVSQTGGDSTLYASFSIAAYQGFYHHKNTNSIVAENVDDTINFHENFFLQGLDGIKGKISIPRLDSLKNNLAGDIGINLAEIIFPVNTSQEFFDTTLFKNPARLQLRYENDGLYYMLPDDVYRENSYTNGYFDHEKLDYRINITEFVHQYLQGDIESNSLLMFVASVSNIIPINADNNIPGRVVLNAENSDNPPFLRIIYTNLN